MIDEFNENEINIDDFINIFQFSENASCFDKTLLK